MLTYFRYSLCCVHKLEAVILKLLEPYRSGAIFLFTGTANRNKVIQPEITCHNGCI